MKSYLNHFTISLNPTCNTLDIFYCLFTRIFVFSFPITHYAAIFTRIREGAQISPRNTLASSHQSWCRPYILLLYLSIDIGAQLWLLPSVLILSRYFGSNHLTPFLNVSRISQPHCYYWILTLLIKYSLGLILSIQIFVGCITFLYNSYKVHPILIIVFSSPGSFCFACLICTKIHLLSILSYFFPFLYSPLWFSCILL